MYENPKHKRSSGALSDYAPLIQMADGLTLSQVCAVSGLEPSTVQNWIKRGFVPHPERKKYRERHLARILLISKLKDSMQIDRVGELLRYLNGDTDDTSDDMISEEELYDLFSILSEKLRECVPPPDKAHIIAEEVMSGYPADKESRDKITKALSVMACTYMANLYKTKADSLFNELKRS